MNLVSLNLSGNQFSGEISTDICNITTTNEDDTGLQWDSTGFSESKSYLFNNKFCPGVGGYPACIEPNVGEQDTTECNP